MHRDVEAANKHTWGKRSSEKKSVSSTKVAGHISPRSSSIEMWPVSSGAGTTSGSWVSIQAVHRLQCFGMVN